MTEQEQNEAICAALGIGYHKPTEEEIKGGSYYQYEPRFTRSQDAIHHAKMALLTTPSLQDAYAGFLGAITGGRSIDRGAMRVEATTAILFANAAQQCEALLRAIGKWKK